MYFFASNYLEAVYESCNFAIIKPKNRDMAKKSIFIIPLLMVVLSFTCVNLYANQESVYLQVGYDDPDDGNDGQQRGPLFIPDVCIDDYFLIFNTPCDGCILRLLDENGAVVYSTVIPSGTTSLVLPSYLSGEYEIQIVRGSIYFYGYILL